MAATVQKDQTENAASAKKKRKPPVPNINRSVKNLFREHNSALSRYEKKNKGRCPDDVSRAADYARALSSRDYIKTPDTELTKLTQELRIRTKELDLLVYERETDPLPLYQQEYLCEVLYFLRSLKNLIIDELNERAAKRQKRPPGRPPSANSKSKRKQKGDLSA